MDKRTIRVAPQFNSTHIFPKHLSKYIIKIPINNVLFLVSKLQYPEQKVVGGENVDTKLCANDIDYNHLYELFYEKLFKIAFYITKDSYLSEDIIQEAFLKAYQKINTIKDIRKIGSWLSTITKRKAIDMVRKESRSQTIPIEDTLLEIVSRKHSVPSIESEIEVLFLHKEVQEKIKYLKPEQREVILLKINKGLRDDEIASMLDLKKSTVKTRVFRARQHLKDLLVNTPIKHSA